ncbi:hypothetical protein F4809DRAFT_462268 [Biscogniauxia mediterranea]|nr:hypothetical protein F4809DRAFT_462268 [Biscogniauxia mediterranea]
MTSTTSSVKSPGSQPAAQEEWIQVRRKGRRRTPGQTQTLTQTQVQPRTAFSSVSVPDLADTKRPPRTSSLTVDEIRRTHERIAAQWAASPCRQRLASALASRPTSPSPVPSPPITSAICLGIGTFDPDDGSWELRRRAHVQLAAFLFMVEQMAMGREEEEGEEPVRYCCVFQEPLFTPADRGFLEGLGHRVVETPDAFGLVGPRSLLFAVHMYRDVYTRAIARHVPAVFVGTAYEVWEDIHGPEEWTCMKELDEKCDKVPYPDDEQLTFSNTYIHWRRDGHS